MVPRVNVIALWPCLIGVVIRNESKSHGILRTVSVLQYFPLCSTYQIYFVIDGKGGVVAMYS